MAVPWLRLLDTALGLADLARGRRSRASAPDDAASQQLEASPRAFGGLEARLAGVVVAALKEAFDRDTRRLELERDQLEAERQRAERALRLELLRQAADREIGRLRLLAGIAVAGAMSALLLTLVPGRLAAAGSGSRALLAAGWLMLLGATAASFAAQASIGRALQGSVEEIPSTPAGAIAAWLIVVGLSLVGLAVLI